MLLLAASASALGSAVSGQTVQNPPSKGYVGLDPRPADRKSLSDAEQIRELLAVYARAVDNRDVEAFRRIFTPAVVSGGALRQDDGTVRIGALTHSLDELVVGFGRLEPLKPGRHVHHFTHDHIVEIQGDTAHMNAQFLVTTSQAREPRPGETGDIGTVETGLTGYYDDELRKVRGRWLITRHIVVLDLPFRFSR